MAFIEHSTPKQDPFCDTVQLMSQGNRAMQRVFPTPNDCLIVICFRLRGYRGGSPTAVQASVRAVP